MRVTQSMYYSNLYGPSNPKINKELFDVNRQIASGLKIQYASDDVRTFTETMRLDNELTTIAQIKKSTESGYKFSDQTDVTMNEFTNSMNRMRTLLVQAANGTNDATSLDAIAVELRGVQKNFVGLANTSINGQYIFSGSAVDTKPIDENGQYRGNDVALQAFVGSKNYQTYNVTGAQFFLGEESLVNRDITSNVAQSLNAPSVNSDGFTSQSTIGELMGASPSGKHYFYLRGMQNSGKSFNEKIEMDNSGTIAQLMKKIGTAYGNTGAIDVVNVTLSGAGQIEVEDKIKGSSKLDFHMVGATDFNATGADDADVTNIDALNTANSDYATAVANGDLYVKEFSRSGLTSATGVSGPEGLIYDRVQFSKDGAKLSSNVPQILKKSHVVDIAGEKIDTITFDRKNGFAQANTLLSEVADISKGTLDTSDDTLDGTSFTLVGTDINGTAYNATVDLKSTANGGSTFSVGGSTYNIFNLETPRVAADADKVTYQQLMDVMNVITTGSTSLLAGNTPTAYDNAVKSADLLGTMSLSNDGRIEFYDLNAASTPASIALYDSNSGNFSLDIDSDGSGTLDKASASVMAFNANNAITIRDPKTDFFKTINEMIEAVENHSNFPDANAKVIRNVGIQNALKAMDDLQDHVFRTQSISGAQSNTLTDAINRTNILEVSTMSLRSSVIDTDLAKSSLRLSQLTTNYQAMLSTVGKVSQLSLVNYL